MNNVSNPKVIVPNGIELNDKNYINSMLSSLKCLVKNYVIALTEASNEHLFEIYSIMLNQLLHMQRETYEVMFRKGWYVLEKCDNNKITAKFNTLTDELNSLNTN